MHAPHTITLLSILASHSSALTWEYDTHWPASPLAAYLDLTNGTKPTGIAYDAKTAQVTVVYRDTARGTSGVAPLVTIGKDKHGGETIKKWGQGKILYAHDLRIDPDTSAAYVMDMGDFTIKALDPNGDVVDRFGSVDRDGHSLQPLEFSNVSAMAFTGDAMFVTDGDSLGSCSTLANHRLVKLRKGRVEWAVGTNGTVDEHFKFVDPHAVDFDEVRDWIWVSDRGNNRTVAFDAKTGAVRAEVDLKPLVPGFTVNGIRIDPHRGLQLLTLIPIGSHLCHSPTPSGNSAIAVLNISDPSRPTKIWQTTPPYQGPHACDYDRETGALYVAFLMDNRLGRFMMKP